MSVLQFAAGSFLSKKLCSTLHSIEVDFYSKKRKSSLFEPPFERLRGNLGTSSIARWKACVRLPIRHSWTFFATVIPSLTGGHAMVSSAADCCIRPTAHALLCIVNGNDSEVFRFFSPWWPWPLTLTFKLVRVILDTRVRGPCSRVAGTHYPWTGPSTRTVNTGSVYRAPVNTAVNTVSKMTPVFAAREHG